MKKYLKNKFIEQYKSEPELYLSCGGRFEVLGNHTDHNHGLCLAATCSLSIYASIKRRDDLLVHLFSEGFTESVIDLSSLDKNVEEKGQPGALVRGVAAYLAKEYKIGGFDIYIKSEIPGGAGVSSSAAFELLFAQTFNKLFNNEQIPLMTLCKAGQFAEREYYGKMCGLLDQIGVAYGGLVYIDFEDIANPKVKPLKAVLENYCFVIVNSGGSHAGLDHLYKAIPDDMYQVAHCFGKDYLREVEEAHEDIAAD
jgi:galactokinase